jgi:hypothetical protein
LGAWRPWSKWPARRTRRSPSRRMAQPTRGATTTAARWGGPLARATRRGGSRRCVACARAPAPCRIPTALSLPQRDAYTSGAAARGKAASGTHRERACPKCRGPVCRPAITCRDVSLGHRHGFVVFEKGVVRGA